MYSGALVGAGSMVFAVMGYAVALSHRDRVRGVVAELNPIVMAAVFGEPEESVCRAITFLSSPDTRNVGAEEEGRRLVRVGQFSYRLVDGEAFRAALTVEERREADRIAQVMFRARGRGLPVMMELPLLVALEDGDEVAAKRIMRVYAPSNRHKRRKFYPDSTTPGVVGYSLPLIASNLPKPIKAIPDSVSPTVPSVNIPPD
jgi:hypothetical protein